MTQNSFFVQNFFSRRDIELSSLNPIIFVFAVVFNTRRLHRLSWSSLDDYSRSPLSILFCNFYTRTCCAQDFHGKLPSLINLAPIMSIELISYHKLDLMALFVVILVHCFPSLSLTHSSAIIHAPSFYGYMCNMCERALDVCAKVINVDCFVAINMKTH